MEVEKATQQQVDEGHSPWRLDPVHVAMTFISLKISPEGIVGEFPIKAEDLKVIQKTGSVVDVEADKSPVKRVYLKRLVREDDVGIWTIVGYDPVEKE